MTSFDSLDGNVRIYILPLTLFTIICFFVAVVSLNPVEKTIFAILGTIFGMGDLYCIFLPTFLKSSKIQNKLKRKIDKSIINSEQISESSKKE